MFLDMVISLKQIIVFYCEKDKKLLGHFKNWPQKVKHFQFITCHLLKTAAFLF